MYSVSYRYNPITTNPYSVHKQPNLNIHNFYSVYKKRNYSFPLGNVQKFQNNANICVGAISISTKEMGLDKLNEK